MFLQSYGLQYLDVQNLYYTTAPSLCDSSVNTDALAVECLTSDGETETIHVQNTNYHVDNRALQVLWHLGLTPSMMDDVDGSDGVELPVCVSESGEYRPAFDLISANVFSDEEFIEFYSS